MNQIFEHFWSLDFGYWITSGATTDMHISEGVLTPQVLAVGAVLATGGLVAGIRELTPERIPRVAVLSSALFVGSLVHIPIGPVSVHLSLVGICGLILGWAAFPSILVALSLQALMFSYGGIIVMGVNITIQALPAVLVYYLFRGMIKHRSPVVAVTGGFMAGAFGIASAAVLLGAALALSGEAFREAAGIAVGAHIPVMLIEGMFTAFCVSFLRKVRPEIINAVPHMDISGSQT